MQYLRFREGGERLYLQMAKPRCEGRRSRLTQPPSPAGAGQCASEQGLEAATFSASTQNPAGGTGEPAACAPMATPSATWGFQSLGSPKHQVLLVQSGGWSAHPVGSLSREGHHRCTWSVSTPWPRCFRRPMLAFTFHPRIQ